jgi:glycosyltransferase involved in cell wall biosynthesis
MRIGLDNVDPYSITGPNTFGARLAKGFVRLEHEVAWLGIDASCEDCDVVLTFIQPTRRYPSGTKVVQRLDGIWFSPKDFEARNAAIKDLYLSCDRVVWQSHFDKGMTNRWWGERPGTVIHNGIATPSGSKLFPLAKKGKKFACVASWHRQKRLKENIDMFLHIAGNDPEAYLYVVGAPDCYINHPQVGFLGPRGSQDVAEVLYHSDWLIHLAWLDHCPNAVVEALAWGCGVIASNSGGTWELLDPEHDVIINETGRYDFELTEYDNPPPIDVTQVKALPSGVRPNFRAPDILDVARSYIRTFEEIV